MEDSWESGRRELLSSLGADPDGFQELCCQLRCALKAKAEFDRLGLSGDIYWGTMGCFSRFVREHQESYGCYGFDRGFWTVRQIICRLFRIGQLEYELTALDGAPAISLHIPSDVQLELPLLRESYVRARAVLPAAFPEYRDAPMFCSSWLLSPVLVRLLPEESRILQFQRSFHLLSTDPNSRGYVQWIFKKPHLSPEDYPEDTRLQRTLKTYLLQGNRFPAGKGVLLTEPFLN